MKNSCIKIEHFEHLETIHDEQLEKENLLNLRICNWIFCIPVLTIRKSMFKSNRSIFILSGDLVVAIPSSGSLISSLTLDVYGDRELSCKQICQAQRAFYAVLSEMSEGAECMCTNTTHNESTEAEQTAQPDQNITMYNLGTIMVSAVRNRDHSFML